MSYYSVKGSREDPFRASRPTKCQFRGNQFVQEDSENDTLIKFPWRKYRIGIHSEPMRIIPYQSEKRFVTRLMENGKKSIRSNPI